MRSGQPFTAVIADDERLLREQLKTRLQAAWPDLQIIGEARDGNEALAKADELRPDLMFLDIRMPGMTGIEAAREILGLPDWHGEIVFVTAYDEYAVAAFEHGAIDYLLKPVEPERLVQTAQRVKARLARRAVPPPPTDEVALDTLMAKLTSLQQGMAPRPAEPLRWIQATTGSTTKLIDVKDVLFFKSDEKYTRVQTRDQEAFIRTPIRELLPQLDPQQFWQIHRSAVVNLVAIAAVTRDDTGRQRVHIREHLGVLAEVDP